MLYFWQQIPTNAPGRSVFNRTERRMAPLSREMSGLILPHETLGSHLDGNGKTIDDALELKIFEHAGKVLATLPSLIVGGSINKFGIFSSDVNLLPTPQNVKNLKKSALP